MGFVLRLLKKNYEMRIELYRHEATLERLEKGFYKERFEYVKSETLFIGQVQNQLLREIKSKGIQSPASAHIENRVGQLWGHAQSWSNAPPPERLPISLRSLWIGLLVSTDIGKHKM